MMRRIFVLSHLFSNEGKETYLRDFVKKKKKNKQTNKQQTNQQSLTLVLVQIFTDRFLSNLL